MYEDIERYRGMPEIYAAKKSRINREENWKNLRRSLYGDGKKEAPTSLLDVLSAILDISTSSTEWRK